MVSEQEEKDGKKGVGLKRMKSPPSEPVAPAPKKADQKDKKRVRYQDNNVHDDTEEMTMEELENSFDKTRRSRLGLGNSSSNLNFNFSHSCSDGGGIGDQSSTLGLCLEELDLSTD